MHYNVLKKLLQFVFYIYFFIPHKPSPCVNSCLHTLNVMFCKISGVMTGVSCVSTIVGVVYCCWRRRAVSRQEPPTSIFRRPVPSLRSCRRTSRRPVFVDQTFNNPLSARNSSSSEENFHELVEMEAV